MSNKQAAETFLKLAASGRVDEAYERYVAPSFVHHNMYFEGDRQSLLDAMKVAHRESPNRSLEVKHAYEDGDTVITHSLVVRENPDEPDLAVVHIFRFAQGRIVEAWDLVQPIDPASPNENGMF